MCALAHSPARPFSATLPAVLLPQNHLIAMLPRRDRLSLLAGCEPVQLNLGAVLARSGEATRHVYFPDNCLISLVGSVNAEHGVGVGLVGREGMLGAQLALGVAAAPLHALVQGAGGVQRMGASRFRHELSGSEPLQRVMGCHAHALVMLLANSAACTRFHTLLPRLARWLLMTHDRAGADSFHLTHQFLACMLGVRRVGITTAAGELQRLGLIHYGRGHITVLDRPGLEAASCSCYSTACRIAPATRSTPRTRRRRHA